MLDVSKYLNVYQFDYNLPCQNKSVKLRPYNAADLKRMLIYSNEEVEEALDVLLQSCIVQPEDSKKNINVEDLWLMDRFYLLLMLRKATKGSIYNFVYKCPSCNSEKIEAIDLKKIKVKSIPKGFDFNVKLDDNITVTLKPPTRKSIKLGKQFVSNLLEENISVIAKAFDESIGAYSYCIEKIITPEGENSPTPEEAYNFLNIAPDFMYTKIQNWFSDLGNYGIDMKTKVSCDYEKCPEFKREREEVVPLDNFLS